MIPDWKKNDLFPVENKYSLKIFTVEQGLIENNAKAYLKIKWKNYLVFVVNFKMGDRENSSRHKSKENYNS